MASLRFSKSGGSLIVTDKAHEKGVEKKSQIVSLEDLRELDKLEDAERKEKLCEILVS
jgi:hypothetical protein